MPSNPLTQEEINSYAISRALNPEGYTGLSPYMPAGYFLSTPAGVSGPALWRLFDASFISSGIIASGRLGTGSTGAGNLYLADDGTWKTISLPTTPTLATVTTAGNTTTNSISVGGLTVGNGAAPIATFNSSNGGGTYLAIQYNGVLKAGWGMGGNIVGAANSVNDVGFWSSNDMFWETNGSSRMTLNSSGRLLMNTITDTGEILQVNGAIKGNSFTSSGGTGFTGTFTVPTNPPGQQNLNISGGIIISVT